MTTSLNVTSLIDCALSLKLRLRFFIIFHETVARCLEKLGQFLCFISQLCVFSAAQSDDDPLMHSRDLFLKLLSIALGLFSFAAEL